MQVVTDAAYHFDSDRPRSVIQIKNRLSSYRHRLTLALPLFFLIWSEVFVVRVISLSSHKNFGSILRDDLFASPTIANGEIAKLDHDGINTANSDPKPITKGYWCDNCSCGFNKHKSLVEHVAGKGHKAVIIEGEIVWKEYIHTSSSSSSSQSSAFYDESVTKMDVARAWSLDLFTEGLRARGRSSKKKPVVSGMVGMTNTAASYAPSSFTGNNSNGGGGNQIDPTLRLCDLIPTKRAALFRYLHVTSSGIPGLTDMVSSLPTKYVRVKELLESMEVYFHIVNMILKRKGRKAKRFKRVYDVGCGHGLVGMLIAASYPKIEVHSFDIEPRDSFLAQREAFESTGTSMDNLMFENGDLSVIRGRKSSKNNGRTLVLCVHGCKELTHESIELARENSWAWLSVPCCLQANDHLNENTSLKIKSDHTRYAMLCGAIAANYHPETVSTIDSRITGRGIVMASSGW